MYVYCSTAINASTFVFQVSLSGSSFPMVRTKRHVEVGENREMSPSGVAASHSAAQEFPNILYNQKVQYRV
jgi:hypothetical protein